VLKKTKLKRYESQRKINTGFLEQKEKLNAENRPKLGKKSKILLHFNLRRNQKTKRKYLFQGIFHIT